jgi:uncharacterized membrane protein YobD (UPF0266 family)
MKKYVGLLIIVLMLPLTSQETAYAFNAILTDDIYCASVGQAFNTTVLLFGIGLLGIAILYIKRASPVKAKQRF